MIIDALVKLRGMIDISVISNEVTDGVISLDETFLSYLYILKGINFPM